MSLASSAMSQSSSASRRLRIGVAIATVGRAATVAETIRSLAGQSRPPDEVLVCSPSETDVEGSWQADPDVTCLIGPHGLPHQRNCLLRAAGDLDLLLFLDDDFVPGRGYIEEMEAVFRDDPAVVMATGRVLADGIKGPGLTFEFAQQKLSSVVEKPAIRLTEVYNGYGCNMAVRLEAVRRNGLLFDEALPLYAWLEDVDFSRSLAPFGRIVRAEWAIGVHLGVKSGRQRGERLGYSQVANPCYLISKGTCSWKKGLFHISRNVAANLYGTISGERAVDRPARLYGNLRGIADLMTQRLAPSRALEL